MTRRAPRRCSMEGRSATARSTSFRPLSRTSPGRSARPLGASPTRASTSSSSCPPVWREASSASPSASTTPLPPSRPWASSPPYPADGSARAAERRAGHFRHVGHEPPQARRSEVLHALRVIDDVAPQSNPVCIGLRDERHRIQAQVSLPGVYALVPMLDGPRQHALNLVEGNEQESGRQRRFKLAHAFDRLLLE